MKTIIAGSRGCTNLKDVKDAIQACGWSPSMVLSGTAPGVDRLGEQWATSKGLKIERYPADWDKFGKSAGYRRNQLMAENAEALIAIWDGESPGTKHMIDIAMRRGLKVYVHKIDKSKPTHSLLPRRAR